jgi:hypothetical protein
LIFLYLAAFLKSLKIQPDLVIHTSSLSTQELWRQKDYKLKAHLVYIVRLMSPKEKENKKISRIQVSISDIWEPLCIVSCGYNCRFTIQIEFPNVIFFGTIV